MFLTACLIGVLIILLGKQMNVFGAVLAGIFAMLMLIFAFKKEKNK
jgi:hypothetical protein